MPVTTTVYETNTNQKKSPKESYEAIMKEIEVKAGSRPKLPRDLSAGKWSDQSLKVLEERYLDRDQETGKVIETPDQMAWRVAFAIASAEVCWGHTRDQVVEQAKAFYKLIVSHKFLPNSPTLMNAGKGNGLQYSACFVLPVEDSIEGIFESLKHQAIIHQSGGGTGFAFSRLRPKGSIVRRSRGVASGPVSFMKIFNEATQQIKQGGTRRGANMGILRIDHPDIREFITCKLDGGITNFNISVAATDKFVSALRTGEKYDLVDPHTQEVVGQEDARTIFEMICDAAWKSGDPGMIFIDRVNDGSANPVPSMGPVESTNPCGEQPLYPYDACNLGSIFLNYFVKTEDGKAVIDWDGLKRTTHQAVRFLDDVIEVNPYPLRQIWETVHNTRRIGLGVGGFADMLYLLGIPYDSTEALDLAEKIMKVINEEGHKASEALAVDRGPFPMWDQSIYKDGKALRNSTVTTIAPTGTIGILAHTSGGIEPVFALAYKHMVKDESLNRELYFVDPAFETVAKREGFWGEALAKEVAEKGLAHDIKSIPEKWRRVFVTAHEVTPDWHVRMQGAWQKYTDNAVSKTINLPHEATVDDVAKAYLNSFEYGCKGITVYRDGCKDWQVLNVGTTKKAENQVQVVTEVKVEEQIAELRVRPQKLQGTTYKIHTPVGSAFVTINQDELGNPFEVFVTVGRVGTHIMADAEALGRLISLSLRIPSALPVRTVAETIVEQLSGIGGADSVGFGNGKVRSLADAVAKVILEHVKPKDEILAPTNGYVAKSPLLGSPQQLEQEALPLTSKRKDICPECGQATLVLEEGCAKCYSCGASKC